MVGRDLSHRPKAERVCSRRQLTHSTSLKLTIYNLKKKINNFYAIMLIVQNKLTDAYVLPKINVQKGDTAGGLARSS